ncbi:sensor histidine kinase [Actinopolyspora lacussalsi]
MSWWDGKLRSLVFDLFVVALLLGEVSTGNEPSGILLVLGYVVCLPFAVRRRFPWGPVLGSVAMLFTLSNSLAPMIASYTMARRKGPGVQLWAAIGVMLAVQVAWTYESMAPGFWTYESMDPGFWLILLLFPPAAVGVPTLLGLWFFQRGMLLVTLRERAEQAERERDLLAERAVAAERRRIAREMHDVVAHRVSVVSLQAGALTMSAPDERTGEVAETIRRTSATALTELRGMLRVLRDDGQDDAGQHHGELAEEPTVGSIRQLVDEAVGTGSNITLDLPEQLPETSGSVGRAAYRVVQEALTNAAKHAPHAAVRIEVATEDGQLVVTVFNQLRRDPDNGTPPGSGYGLIGMRERVTLAGGTLRTGHTEDGGYRVRAVFPIHTDEVTT